MKTMFPAFIRKNVTKIINYTYITSPKVTPAQAMPETYREENPIEAYRSYYLFEKNKMFSWKKREEPEWLLDFYKLFE